jgi:hypothetical protein
MARKVLIWQQYHHSGDLEQGKWRGASNGMQKATVLTYLCQWPMYVVPVQAGTQVDF